MSDHYSTLGVQKNASAADIKQAYKKLVMKYHPDRNTKDKEAAETKFKKVNAAYEILKDEKKRAAYDQYGDAAFQNGASSGGTSNGGFNFSGDFGDFSDVFGDIFGDFMGNSSKRSNARGADLRCNISVTLEEAYKGAKKHINYKTNFPCGDCNGSGSGKNTKEITCLNCGGSGKTVRQQGFFAVEQVCQSCNGYGKTIKDPCRKCYGEGRYVQERSIDISIPSGIDDGSKIRITGAGESGARSASAGDLYIFVTLTKHRFFSRVKEDLYCSIPIKMTTAILGGTVNVPSIDGKACKVTIPTGAQPGLQLRLKSKGMPRMRSKLFGDLLVKIDIEIPSGLNEKQRQLVQQLDMELDIESSKKDSTIFSRVKNFWSEIKK